MEYLFFPLPPQSIYFFLSFYFYLNTISEERIYQCNVCLGSEISKFSNHGTTRLFELPIEDREKTMQFAIICKLFYISERLSMKINVHLPLRGFAPKLKRGGGGYKGSCKKQTKMAGPLRPYPLLRRSHTGDFMKKVPIVTCADALRDRQIVSIE